MGLCDPDEDQAVMIGYFRAVKSMEAWEAHLQAEEMRKAQARQKRR